jgi:hypothetical protein
MFAPPDRLDAEVFTRIPDTFHVAGRTSEWASTQLHGAHAPVFLEGPSFDREGNLWVVDIPWGRIFRIDPKGGVELVVEYAGEPNGLKFHPDGRAFIADCRNGIMVLDPKTGRIEPYLERARLEKFKGCNDLFFASNGDLWFTDQGQTGLHDPTGRLFRLRTDGQLDIVLQGIPSPNGLVMNLDETAIFLAVTRDNAIWRVPLDGRRHGHQGRRVHPDVGRRRAGRHRAGFAGRPGRLPRRLRRHLDLQPARRAAVPHRLAGRPVHHQLRLRRRRPPHALHRRVALGDHPEGAPAGGRAAHAFACEPLSWAPMRVSKYETSRALPLAVRDGGR